MKYKLYIITITILLIFLIYYDIYNTKKLLLQQCIIITQKYDLYPFFNSYNTKVLTKVELDTLLNINNTLPTLDNYELIPNRLSQIYMFYKNPIPQYIFDNIKKYASNYEYSLLNENYAVEFLTKYFDYKIITRFNDLKFGAHKADLLRYCYLYVYGGIYLDIKVILIKHLDTIFKNKKYFYSTLSPFNKTLHNGFIASKPRNKLFLQLIWHIINIPLYQINNRFKLYYLSFCQDFYIQIQNDLISNHKLHKGLNFGKNQNYYLFQEKITSKLESKNIKLDQYGINSNIYDNNEKIFIGRDPNFPWK